MNQNQHNPLQIILSFAIQRSKAYSITGTMTAERAAAISKIQKEANHFKHLPPGRQSFKVVSLADAIDVIKSENPRFFKKNQELLILQQAAQKCLTQTVTP